MDPVNISSCLICFGSLEFPRNLCDANYKKLLELLCILLGFQVEIQGGVFNICRTCEGKLVWVDEFKDLCEKSLEKFKNSVCKKELVDLNHLELIVQKKEVIDDKVSELESEDEIRKRPKKRKKRIIKRSPLNLRKPKLNRNDLPNDVVSQGAVDYVDNSTTPNQINEEIPDTNTHISDFEDDPPFLSDNEDSDYRPHKSDSDSDYRTNKLPKERKKSLAKSGSKRGPKPKAKIKEPKPNIKRNRKYSTQYSEAEVLQAIAEYESYMTDMKNRKCIHCDYEAPNAKSLRMHMTFKHKEEFITWCKHCNIQTDDHQMHRDSVRCFEERCKFCKKVCPSKKNFPQHLRSHCLKVKENKPLEEARWKICDQYPKDQVLQAIAISTKYMTDLKNRTCLYCNYIATTAKTLTVHLRFGHKEHFDTWCSRCNIQTDNLKTHMDSTKCFENICSLCNKKFTKINRLTRHLESHCRDVFKKLDENIDWDDDIIPHFEDLPSVGVPATPDIAASIIDDDNNSEKLTIKNLTDSNRTSNLEHKNILDNLKDDSRVSDADLSATPSSEDSADEDGNIGDKKLKNRPLKQFPQKKVQRAITESMKSFYTNRKCIKCGFLTSNSKCLGAHMASHKNLKDKWCSRCNTLVGNLTKHWIGHKNDILKCIFCDKSSESIDNLKDHLKRHCRSHTLDLKGKWFSCKICPASFPEEQHLKDHKCLEVNAFVVCVLCKKRVRNLRIHMAQRHKSLDLNLKPKNKADALRKRLCPICGKTFMVSYLAAHMYTHTGEMPYKCSYCGKGFAIMSILRSHEKRHSGEKPFVCHICGKGFVTSSEHRSHIQIHEGGPVQCTICNKEFSRPGVLKLHMRRHTGENQFYCVHCGISFHRKSLLLNHMRRHNNERPFKCSFCEKDFRDPSTLKKHEHIHKGIKPYKCSICSFSCTQSQGLSLHMKQHPEDAPQADRPYKCFFCYRQFNTNAMLMSHTNNHHRDSTR